MNHPAGGARPSDRSQIPKLLRRLEPPRTWDGRADYRPPAAILAACTAFVLFFSGFYLALYSKFFHHHRHLALTAVLAGAALLSLAAYAIVHRLLARFGLYLWQSIVASLVLLTIMSSAPDWARTLFPRVDERYERELGGPGRCLYNTPYNLDRTQTTFADDHPDRMLIDPIDEGLPVLRLDHAVDGGLQHLAPADTAARKILDQYGC
ncbi:hypothetical protein AB0393_28910 [Streptomyces cyaneofuscatus]|uniref:hypothetical protein n=1 Tax=Streptomyces cyaneofuscatus TaxID=66883 RepID=UPI00344FC8CE